MGKFSKKGNCKPKWMGGWGRLRKKKRLNGGKASITPVRSLSEELVIPFRDGE